MFQPEQNSIKRDIAFIAAIAAAGFKLTNSRSVNTHDGAAWHATLTHGRTKIVTVSNGGHGGPDQSDFHATTDTGKAADKVSLEELFAVPEVAAAVRGHMLFNLDLDQQFNKVEGFDYSAAKADIETRVPVPTADDDEKGEYMTYKLADTPANREKVRVHEKNRKIDYFIADLFGSTNESKGA